MSSPLFRIAVVAAATSLAAPALSQSADGIVVYNAQHESLTRAWGDGFTKETGVKVTLRKGSDMELANQIVQEGAASPADVFITENSPGVALVDKAGLFAPLSTDTLAQVPENFRPGNGHWTGVAARTTVFAYDKTKLDAAKLPKSLLELAEPAWKGRWGASPAGADFQAVVAGLIELKGEATALSWVRAMKENAKTYKGNSVAMKAVNAGEVEGAVIYHYYWFGDQARTGENSAHVALHYFRNGDPGAFLSISGAGVLASSKHQAQAQAFVKWMTGRAGQAILRDGDSYEYAIAAGAESHARLEPLAKLGAPKIEPSRLDNRKATDLLTAAGLL